MAETAVVARLKAVLTGDSAGLRRDLDQSTKRLSDFSAKAGQVGRSLTTKLTLPLAGVAAGAVKVAADFEKSMSMITALVGVAADEVRSMESDVRSMAVEFGKSGTEAADALFFITSAGLRGADATDTLAASLKASAIGLGDTATIADLATSALNAYGSDVLSAAEATDVMTATVREGKLQASELAGSMGRVLPLASAMGVSFNEVGAAFAALSRTGTNAAEAATQIRGILSSLLRPTKQAEEAMNAMGLSSAGLREQIADQGLLATLQTLADEFAGNEAAAAAVFGNIRALSGVLDLMGANVATTEAIFANMADTTGAVDDAFSVMSQTASFQFAQAMAEVKDALLTLGQELLPIVTDALGVVTGVVSDLAGFFGGLDDGTKQLVISLGGMLAVAGPLALGISGVSRAFVAFKAANPWVLGISAAFAGLSVVLGQFYREAREARERQESLTQAFRDANDPATIVVDRLEKVAESMSLIKGREPEAEAAFRNFVGGLLLDSEIAKNGVTSAFRDMSEASLDAIQQFVEAAPTEEQTNFLKSDYALIGDAIADLERIAASATGPVSELAQSLLDSGDIADMTVDELNGIIRAVKNTGKAHADHVSEVEAANREYLTSTKVFEDFGDVLGRGVVQSYISAAEESGNYTEQAVLLLRATGYASAELEMIGGHLDNVATAASSVVPPFDAFAQTLVNAGDIAGQDIEQIAALADQLGILDGMSADLKVELGLDVVGMDAVRQALDELIKFYEDFYDRLAAGTGMALPVNPTLDALRELRNGLEGVESAATGGSRGGGGGGGGGGVVEAIDEVDRSIEQLASTVSRYGKNLLGRDFAESLLGGSREQILEAFRDMMDDVTSMMEDVTDKSLVAFVANTQGKFARLGRLADLRDRLQQELDQIRSVVESASSLFSTNLQATDPEEGVDLKSQLAERLSQAREFVSNVRKLSGMGFPGAIIGDVVNAGLVNGAAMAAELARFSPDEVQAFNLDFYALRETALQASSLIGDLLGEQGVELRLDRTNEQMAELVSAIQNDLGAAFDRFLAGLGTQVDRLTGASSGTSGLFQHPIYGYIPTSRSGMKGGDGVTVVVNAGMGTDGTAVGKKIVEVLNEYGAAGGAKLSRSVVG